MRTQVRECPKCFKLMWGKDEDIDYPDENTVRYKCPHCSETVRFKLVTGGDNATGPKMGH